jgi:restriction system protein
MSIPDFQAAMLPLLRFAADGGEHALADVRENLAKQMQLTEEDRSARLQSGSNKWANRVAWAKVYLERAGLLRSTRRGFFQITDRGAKVIASPPDRITVKFLSQYPEFTEFVGRKKQTLTYQSEQPASETPEEIVDRAYLEFRNSVESELLEKVKAASPQFFERLVVELLQKMGYGGSRSEAGKAIGRSGDEGIDGVINQDLLGLDVVYIQAKRWEGSVGRPEIQKFVGALHGKQARKGVFITTGTFTADAEEYVAHIEPKIILIDGKQLAVYMLEFGLGVTTKTTYRLNRLDLDYFDEE